MFTAGVQHQSLHVTEMDEGIQSVVAQCRRLSILVSHGCPLLISPPEMSPAMSPGTSLALEVGWNDSLGLCSEQAQTTDSCSACVANLPIIGPISEVMHVESSIPVHVSGLWYVPR